MRRFVISAALLICFVPVANAQPAPSGPPVGAPPQSIVIPVTSAKPPYGFYKSGGVLVGADGYLPFDTGPFLLGGYDGLTRYSGSFVMVPPGPPSPLYSLSPPMPDEFAGVSGPVISSGKHGRLFHRR